eukprot:COSAG01_NODE_414_length_17360_cov_226.576907_12_plen_81_part_00
MEQWSASMSRRGSYLWPSEDGTASHPFSSLHATVDAVRELKASHSGVLPTPVEVMLEPGTHFLTETMLIDTAALCYMCHI